MDHFEVGQHGENLARKYLLKNKYRILFCNYRFKHWEIDIIAKKKDVLCFVEVKTRKYRNFKQEKDLTSLAEEALTLKKRKHFLKASQIFLLKNPKYENLAFQFSLLAIYLFDNHLPIFNFYENILE